MKALLNKVATFPSYLQKSVGLEYTDGIPGRGVRAILKRGILRGTIYQPLRSGRIWHKVNF